MVFFGCLGATRLRVASGSPGNKRGDSIGDLPLHRGAHELIRMELLWRRRTRTRGRHINRIGRNVRVVTVRVGVDKDRI